MRLNYRKSQVRARLLDHILLTLDGTSFRVDDIDFQAAPNVRFTSPDYGVRTSCRFGPGFGTLLIWGLKPQRMSYRRYWEKELHALLLDEQPLIIHQQVPYPCQFYSSPLP